MDVLHLNSVITSSVSRYMVFAISLNRVDFLQHENTPKSHIYNLNSSFKIARVKKYKDKNIYSLQDISQDLTCKCLFLKFIVLKRIKMKSCKKISRNKRILRIKRDLGLKIKFNVICKKTLLILHSQFLTTKLDTTLEFFRFISRARFTTTKGADENPASANLAFLIMTVRKNCKLYRVVSTARYITASTFSRDLPACS